MKNKIEELKTLKDLENERYYRGSPDTRIYSWRLKDESIKFIKEILKHKNKNIFTIQGRTHFVNEWLAILDYVIWYNDITEEDLK